MINDYEIIRFQQRRMPRLFIILKYLLLTISCYLFFSVLPAQINSVHQETDSFRVRVVANSNTFADQRHKQEIANEVALYLEASGVGKSVSNQEIKEVIQSKFSQTELQVKIGENLFPPKVANGIFSPQNTYHSLVVVIGSGRGDNWWCSLFKSVCEKDPDDDKKEKENDETEEEEPAKFWIWEWLKDLF